MDEAIKILEDALKKRFTAGGTLLASSAEASMYLRGHKSPPPGVNEAIKLLDNVNTGPYYLDFVIATMESALEHLKAAANPPDLGVVTEERIQTKDKMR